MTRHFDAAEISEMLLLAKSEEFEESGQASCGHGMRLNQGQKKKKPKSFRHELRKEQNAYMDN